MRKVFKESHWSLTAGETSSDEQDGRHNRSEHGADGGVSACLGHLDGLDDLGDGVGLLEKSAHDSIVAALASDVEREGGSAGDEQAHG